MDADSILDYWCNPFGFIEFGFNEKDLFSDQNTTVFLGGRGTGKTMLFKYASYTTQWRKSIVENNQNPLNHFLKHGGAGFYVRIDGPVLRSFEGFDIKDSVWTSIFTHYFELTVAKSYLDFLKRTVELNLIDVDKFNSNFIPALSLVLCGDKSELVDIFSAIERVDNQLDQVTQFRGMVPLSPIKFNPTRGFTSQSLTAGIPELANKHIKELEGDFQFILLIDEYENYLEQQQQVINTLLRFSKPNITYRIGMRLEGFRTYGTINKEEFIKEGRDYSKVVFEEFLVGNKGYRDYLLRIAEKRLSATPIFKQKQYTDIRKILGSMENPEEEARDIVKGNTDRIFDFYKIKGKPKRKLLECKDNPLLQVLNCLWFIRGNSPKDINKAMNDYKDKKNSELAKKYHRDYIDKYKLSLTFIVCTIYRKPKSYYSFNTFAFVSSGIVGHFIELCRRSFQLAEFEQQETLLNEGVINSKVQAEAAKEQASSELQQIRRVEKHGHYLYHFILNLGNIFSLYHKDPKIRYPEMNQFTVDKDMLSTDMKAAFESGLKWSLVQRKKVLQKSTPGKSKGDLYTINRIFAPVFEISYRTRGGINEDFSPAEILSMMTVPDTIGPKKLKLSGSSKQNNDEQGVQGTFDY